MCKCIKSKEYAENRQLLLEGKSLEAYTRVKSCSDAGAGSFLTEMEMWFLVYIMKLNIINLKPNSTGGYYAEKHIYSPDKAVSFTLSDGFGSFDYLILAKGSTFDESKLPLGVLINGVDEGVGIDGRDVKGDINPTEFVYTPDSEKKCYEFDEKVDSPKLDSKPKVKKEKPPCMKHMQGFCQEGESCQYSHKVEVIRKFLDQCNARFPIDSNKSWRATPNSK